ncbi:2Fe-2S iron-sulfur cluster-binding protein [Streptomyces kutzneri]|uniref:2Fe-2S iron-sulfur cluster-binding protein n=1 Tax=Streptomyces kutzneri TaxID=3051179 RepID=UPI0028D3E07E|nr:2Fe-2S iron-sulfur cluster binding domain-containing protein [Streptomyces sp. DSM 40907]
MRAFPLSGNTASRPRPAYRLQQHTPPQPEGPHAERPAPARGRRDPARGTAPEGPGTAADRAVRSHGGRRRGGAAAPLLDALLAAGITAPYSCREGACSACCCRVVEGEVELSRNEVLDETDLAEGCILACQALPPGPTVRITYG